MKFYIARISLLSLLMLTAAPVALAANTATVTISATVLADCSVTVNHQGVLDIGRIAVSELHDKAKNAALDGMVGSVDVTSKCGDSTRAKLTVSTQTVADKSIVASSPSGVEADVMRFGLKIDDKAADFDDASKSVTSEINDENLSSDGHTDTLTFSGLAGANSGKATAGSYSATVTVKVEPE